jgi:hypothetical protein
VPETLPSRRALMFLNHHRIGNADETAFDMQRYGVADQSKGHSRLQTALGTVTGTPWL